jgi:hypothetical protein
MLLLMMLLTTTAINDATAKKGSAVKPQGRVIIMDEVDGMGAGDRGGYVYTPFLFKLTIFNTLFSKRTYIPFVQQTTSRSAKCSK